MRWERYGPNALLIRFADAVGDESINRGRALGAAFEEHPPPGSIECVPAFTTMMLEFDPHAWPEVEAGLEEWMPRLEKAVGKRPPPKTVKEVDVVYDGPDLERVAKAHSLSVEEVCQLHSGTVYKVYCLGFSPGFPYLGDLDRRLHTPRLTTPRTRVAAGSVAIGGEHTGIYPVESPGGWNVIGHTTTRLFDPERRGPAGELAGMFYLHPGDQVKFVPKS